MLQTQHHATRYKFATTRRASQLLAVRAELARTLDRARVAYTFDASLSAAVDAFVAELRCAGESVDDMIDAVSASVRVIRPAGDVSSDGAWERTWRAYFDLYDAAIQRAIRTFVVGSLEEDVCATPANATGGMS